ncbi:hypothetical protein ColLi_12319 [Colletotrichum liriopes]|uniref:Uncharacterized protein n=1 Tax=Colletotrichum liriopes TaxID=708192 RepID=A0AA37H021_9PEZI|nr:hypothetical protein ColLi_12319 [Colletotrichum liriopes]
MKKKLDPSRTFNYTASATYPFSKRPSGDQRVLPLPVPKNPPSQLDLSIDTLRHPVQTCGHPQEAIN